MFRMKIGNSFKNLLDNTARIYFSVSALLDNSTEKFSSVSSRIRKLHKRVPFDCYNDFLIAFINVIISDNVFVSN